MIHIIIGLGVGGAENMLQKLIMNSPRHFQHEVISLTTLGEIGQELKSEGVPIKCLNLKSTLDIFSVFFRLRGYLKEKNPDVVQTWMYHADFIGGLAAKSAGIDAIFWNVRNTFLKGRGFANFFFRKLCSVLSNYIPQKVIYVSYSARKQHELAGYSIKKSVVIGNGFDIDKFRFSSSDRKSYREQFGVSLNDVLVASVGRFDPAKDHKCFVDAIKLASELFPGIRGVLLGNKVDKANSDLLHWIGDAKDNFILLGGRRDVPKVLSAIDVFCLHSKTEGFPNVLGEAMSVGLPCVATKAGDAEIILNNSEFTADISDSKMLSQKIIEILSLSDEQRAMLGSSNRKRIIESYSINSIAGKYEKLYLGLL